MSNKFIDYLLLIGYFLVSYLSVLILNNQLLQSDTLTWANCTNGHQ